MPGFNNGVCFAENGFDFTGGAGNAPATNALGGSNPGITNRNTVQNTSNTASSQATFKATVGGTSSGNCWNEWTVGTTRTWGLGIENAASQRLTLSTDAAGNVTPGGGNYIFSATAGATSFLSTFTFWVPSVSIGGLSNPGATVDLNIANTSATSGSDSRLNIQVNNGGGAGGGNAYIAYTGPANNWTHGVDKTDSNKWKLQQAIVGAFPGGTNSMICTPNGEVTFPNTPAFLVYLSASETNITGDGTIATIGSVSGFTKIFDQNSDFSGTTFTAPVSGKYRLGAFARASGYGTQTSNIFQIFTSNRAYSLYTGNPTNMKDANNRISNSLDVLADMDAGDTALITIDSSGSTKTVGVDFNLSSNPLTMFYGKLEC